MWFNILKIFVQSYMIGGFRIKAQINNILKSMV